MHLEKSTQRKMRKERRTGKDESTGDRAKAETVTLYRKRPRKDRSSRKSAGRMPWHWEPKKDVISCEKPLGGANSQ